MLWKAAAGVVCDRAGLGLLHAGHPELGVPSSSTFGAPPNTYQAPGIKSAHFPDAPQGGAISE
jgi:hypothetical protein